MTREQVEMLKRYMIRKYHRRSFTCDELIVAAAKKGFCIDRRDIRGMKCNYPSMIYLAMVRGLDEMAWK